jgi:phosphoglycolate phosphatase
MFEGCRELFHHLTQGGLKLGILSADSTNNVNRFIDRHQLRSQISLGMGGDKLFHKPDPRLFHQTCELMGVKPDRVIMVGDAQGDIVMAQGAKAGGTIGICWHNINACHLDNADVTIDNLNQIQVIAP